MIVNNELLNYVVLDVTNRLLTVLAPLTHYTLITPHFSTLVSTE